MQTLKTNTATGEPYLTLPEPHSQIIITPPRMSDLASVVRVLNDPKVFSWMTGPPHPYLPEHGVSWLESQIRETEEILEHLRNLKEGDEGKLASGCPFRILRKPNDDGMDEYLGYLGLYPSERNGIEDDGEREKVLQEDAKKTPGDPTILWDIAYYLVPSHHGQGIMSTAIKTIIKDWGLPGLNINRIQASILSGNTASIRVLEKIGFKAVMRIPENWEEVRGEMKGIHWLEWNRLNS